MCASGTLKTKDFARDFECGERARGEREIVLSESFLPKGDGREKKLKLMARAGGGVGWESVQQRKHAIIFCNALPPAMFPRK